MAKRPLISRDELLGGFAGGGNKRRAAIALSLIEARTGQLVRERGNVQAPFVTESAFQEDNQAFLRAIAEDARGGTKPSIRDLERFASRWRSLVPDSPGIRAAMAAKLGESYRFGPAMIPGIVGALGLDDPAVAKAFQAQQGEALASIYHDRMAVAEQLRWAWSRFSARLEALPPFWTAFALTLTETVGAGTLALPIALATIGPMAGAAVLIIIGLINFMTVGYMAEASARNASLLYGSAFVGRLVRDFLGQPTVVVLRLCLFSFCCTMLIALFTGFASALADFSGLPAQLWVTVIFGFGMFLILRKTLAGTVASALLIGFTNIGILLLLSTIALTQASWENLTYVRVPFLFGEPFDPTLLDLVFGIVMTSYFGHVSVSNCAQAVLRREPDGGSLKRGTMAAMAVAILIYTLWAVAIAGAVGPERLASETGTALAPLAERLGPGVHVLGTVFVLLGLGMGSVHFSLGIFNMAREILTGRARPDRAAPVISAVDLLQRRPGERRLITCLMRQEARVGPPVTAAALASDLNVEEAKIRSYLSNLTADGLVSGRTENQETVYQVAAILQRRGYVASPRIDAALSARYGPARKSRGPWLGAHLLSALRKQQRTNFEKLPSILALVPIVLIFLYTQWSFYSGTQSFTKPLELVGALLTPVLAGLIPVLLLMAARNRGRASSGATLPAIVTSPPVIAIITFLSFASLLLHGLVIWDEPPRQAAALAIVGIMLLVITDLLRKKAFAPRTLIELRQMTTQAGGLDIQAFYKGEPLVLDLTIGHHNGERCRQKSDQPITDFENCREIVIDLPAITGARVMFSALQVAPDFSTKAIKGQVALVSAGSSDRPIDLVENNGEVTLSPASGHEQLVIALQ